MARVVVDHGKCVLCGLCVEYCPGHVFDVSGGRIVADSGRCVECYACVPLCPTGAISIEEPDP